MQIIKVYVTSKRKHAKLLLNKLREYEGIHVVSRWMETVGLHQKPATHFIQENFDDIVSSHAVIVYAELGDRLRLSIGEVYYALAHGKPIFAVGQHVENADNKGTPGTVYHEDYEDWSYFYPSVRRVGSLDEAVKEIKEMLTRSDRLEQLTQGLRRVESSVHDLRVATDPIYRAAHTKPGS